MSGYCDIAPGHPIHGPYHDREYGFPVTDDRVLFERLALEIFQAGLSWEIVLKKRAAIGAAFRDFDLAVVAAFTETDVERLLVDAGIIRNRLKVLAIIENAKRIMAIQAQFGSFTQWLAAHHPLDKAGWVKLFKRTFKFTGGEIVGEFLMSIGYLPGAHRETCPIFKEITHLGPAWRDDVA